jgi:putative ABC transport system permease protein
MLGPNCKIAFRNLRRNTFFSAINIIGLAIGLATCLLITLFVTDELSYDKYNKNAGNIYRINTNVQVNGNRFNQAVGPAQLGSTLVKDYPQIKNMVRFLGNGDILIKKDKETIMEHNATYADSTLFDVFTLPLIEGDPKTALTQPLTMVISESMAKKYFGTTDALGKTLVANNTQTYTISGVMKEIPAQSHFHFNFIMAMRDVEDSRNTFWLSHNFTTYLLAQPGTTEQTLNRYLRQTIVRYLEPQLKDVLHSSLADIEQKGDFFRYSVIRLTDIHLHSDLGFEFEANSDIQYVYIFIIIAALILLVACINFMNLSTARLADRSKEVGIKKVLGSLRSGLIVQFLTESVITCFMALLLALLIVFLLLPYFNQLSGKHITISHIINWWLAPALLTITVIVGIMAGSYPAFYLSSFKPIAVLKGKLATGFKSGWLRNSLVTFQFATAIILIIGTFIIYSQLNYMHNKNTGYNREQVLILKNTYSLWIHAKTFKEEVQKLPGVTAATMTSFLPTNNYTGGNGFFKDATLNIKEGVMLGHWFIDADYVPAMGMQIVKGRNFSPLYPTDSAAVLINESAAHLLGYSDPINKMIYQDEGSNRTPVGFRIIGVIKDFNIGSLRNKIQPVLFKLAEERGAMAFRIHTADIPGLLQQIKKKYHAVPGMAGQPFLYSFMDENFNKLYEAEQRTARISISFAILAIVIACIGLFGLVTYAAEQRIKEIGIRKVLGATVSNIVQLLAKDFLKLVLLATIIAFPVAWYSMHKWLQNFAYRTAINWWIFIIAAGLALFITLITISVRALKAAMANPMRALRSE